MMVAPALSRIHQISIRAHDTERAVTFYRDTLGLRLLFQAPGGLAFFDCGGVRLMLSPPEPASRTPGSSRPISPLWRTIPAPARSRKPTLPPCMGCGAG